MAVPQFGQWTSQPKQTDPKKISNRYNKYGSALISEGGALAGAAAGAAIGSVVPVVGTGIGALLGGGIGGFTGRLAENKIRDDDFGGWSAAQEGGLNMIPFGAAGGFVRRVGKPTTLMATHNLTADNLLHADKLGGLPQPSVGIVDPDKGIIDGFGDITLIGNEKLVDPKAPKTKTFGSDVYSPRQPRGKAKLEYGQEKALKSEVQKALDNYGNGYLNLDSTDDHLKSLQDNGGIMGHFLESKGIKSPLDPDRVERIGLVNQISDLGYDRIDDFKVFRNEALEKIKPGITHEINPEIDDKLATKIARDFLKSINHKIEPVNLDAFDKRGVLRRTIEKNNLESDFENFTKELFEKYGGESKLFGGWTPSGAKRELPETLENALKVMRKDPLRAGEGNYGIGSLRAQVTPAFKSIDDIYENKNKLVKSDDFETTKDQLNNRYNELAYDLEEAAKRKGIVLPDPNDALEQYITSPPNSNWSHLFREKWGAIADDIDEFRDKLKYAPTEYFESVSDRAVNLSEFEKALVPEGTPANVLERLKAHGIESMFYDDTHFGMKLAGKPQSRKELLKKLMDEDNAKRFNPDGTPKTPDVPEPAPKIFREGGETYRENGTEMVARERFNIPALKKISSGGSDRDVYDLGDGHVLKVSKTARGLAQNEAEVDYYAQSAGLIPETVEAGKNYVVAKKMNKPDKNTREMVKILGQWMPDSDPLKVMNYHGYPGDDLANYDYMTGDFRSIRNWGTTPDGKPIHIDGGSLNRGLIDQYTKPIPGDPYRSRKPIKNLDDPDFREVYHKSKAAKKKYADMDKATMYGIAGLLGGGTIAGKALTNDENNYGGWSAS